MSTRGETRTRQPELCQPDDGARTVLEWFVANEAALASALARAKLRACDHCRLVGWLIGHGRLCGYAESSSDRVVRGHRLVCSKRYRQRGCGRTVTVWLAAVVPRRIVRATAIFALLVALAEGASVAATWRRTSPTALRTAYRIRGALALASPTIRTALLSRAPPPSIPSPSPDAQLLAHVRAVFGDDVTSFDRFQLAFQRSLLP